MQATNTPNTARDRERAPTITALAGVVLMVIGVTLLSGAAQALAALGGAVVFVFAVTWGLQSKSWDQDRRREPPMPPGGGSVSQNF